AGAPPTRCSPARLTSCSSTPPTRWAANRSGRRCARLSTVDRSAASTCSAGGAGWPGCARTWAASAPGWTPSAPGWPWTSEVANAQHWVSAARRLVDQVNDEVDNAWSRALAALPRPMAARFRPSMPRPRPPVPADETRNRAEVAHRVGALVDAAQHLVFDVE